jgi:cbb3-type cytochrome oxidase subunit 3
LCLSIGLYGVVYWALRPREIKKIAYYIGFRDF